MGRFFLGVIIGIVLIPVWDTDGLNSVIRR